MGHSLIIFLSCLTGATKTVFIANIIWFLSTILLIFVVPSFAGFIAVVFCGVLFLVVPVANYIRMLLAIRRHHRQLGDTVASQQMSVLIRREKKVALDMCMVAVLLLASLLPVYLVEIVQLRFPRVHSILFPWSLTIALMKSSINPLFYCWRNKHLRSALKPMITPGPLNS